jgi:hypothetical protein
VRVNIFLHSSITFDANEKCNTAAIRVHPPAA